MDGNVWEWLEDVWYDNYSGAPVDGSAWTDGEPINCDRRRVVRGGSWNDSPGGCRSAGRYGILLDGRGNFLEFRVARAFS
jgi:formylglycine-generating enzyme required for sulfatase activity